MSSPMFDLPEHLKIGVNLNGDGPICEDEPGFSHYVCWCGRAGCTAYAHADDS